MLAVVVVVGVATMMALTGQLELAAQVAVEMVGKAIALLPTELPILVVEAVELALALTEEMQQHLQAMVEAESSSFVTHPISVHYHPLIQV
jgi:hypothetical protein